MLLGYHWQNSPSANGCRFTSITGMYRVLPRAPPSPPRQSLSSVPELPRPSLSRHGRRGGEWGRAGERLVEVAIDERCGGEHVARVLLAQRDVRRIVLQRSANASAIARKVAEREVGVKRCRGTRGGCGKHARRCRRCRT